MSIEKVFSALNDKGVKYLLVGELASVLHGVPRTTMDIDISIGPEKANLKKCISALKGIGMSSDTEHIDEILGQGGITFDNGLSVDLLTKFSGTPRASARGGMERGELRVRQTCGSASLQTGRSLSQTPPALAGGGITDLPKGEDFERLWKGRCVVEYQGIELTVISKRDLRRILKKVGRKQDVEDLEYLKGPG